MDNGPTLLTERIQAQRAGFSPKHELIAMYILDHALEAALLTATELAQRLDVDPATVVRFAQKLGYRGYLELKTDLGRLVRRDNLDTASPPVDSLGQALETARLSLSTQFDQVWQSLDRVDLIQWAEALGTPCRLLLLADEPCVNLAAWLAGELRSFGFKIDTPAGDPGALASSMMALDRYDRVLILEGSLPSPTLGHLIQDLRGKKIRSLALVGSASSSAANLVEVVLHIGDIAASTTLMQQLLATILHAVQHLQSVNNSPGAPVVNDSGDGLGNSDEW
jgi:DNA-binding MurR/RpiR family transcriptional regulator